MAKILLLGAGKSATVLIEELAKWEADGRIKFTLCDPNYEQLKPQFNEIVQHSLQWNDLDVTNEKALSEAIMANDLVISSEIRLFLTKNFSHKWPILYILENQKPNPGT